MLGRNEFALRQGLPAAKRLYGAKAPPHRVEPRSCPASILCGQDKKAPVNQVLFCCRKSGRPLSQDSHGFRARPSNKSETDKYTFTTNNPAFFQSSYPVQTNMVN